MTSRDKLIKGAVDYVLTMTALILLAPLLLLIGLLVKITSEGPVLYKQKRQGLDEKEFYLYKFRTMYIDECDDDEIIQATKNDSRITKLGCFLRKTSIDELPQLFNILKGEMSLVGPRPHAVQHGDYYKDKIDGYMNRHHVKPGLTGWAQVNGLRGETRELEKMQRRIEYDLCYIDNWSLGLDFKIMLKTMLLVIYDAAAY